MLARQAVFALACARQRARGRVSTLASAALFLPVRRRVQSVVDRRFYRSKIDAEATLAGFGARLQRRPTSMGSSGELDGVVRDAMQPAWSRSGFRNDPETVAE